MNFKLFLSLLFSVLFLNGCTNNTNTLVKVSNQKESATRTLFDGTWIVKQTANTPIRSNLMKSRYFQYYSGLHANSIGCKSYSQIEMKVAKNEKAYKCVVNGKFLTKDSLAIGTPWQ